MLGIFMPYRRTTHTDSTKLLLKRSGSNEFPILRNLDKLEETACDRFVESLREQKLMANPGSDPVLREMAMWDARNAIDIEYSRMDKAGEIPPDPEDTPQRRQCIQQEVILRLRKMSNILANWPI